MDDRITKVRAYFRRLEEVEQRIEEVEARKKRLEAVRDKIQDDINRILSGQPVSRHRRVPKRAKRKQPNARPALLRVAEALRAIGEPADAKTVAAELDVSPQVARVRLIRAADADIVRRVNRGKYTVPESSVPRIPKKRGRRAANPKE